MSANRFDGERDNRDDFTGPVAAGGLLMATRYVAQETQHVDGANPDGSMTVAAGEEETILRWEDEGPLALYAIGASDASDAEYVLKTDNQVQSITFSPLGSIVDPFSFVEVLGAPLGAEQVIELVVKNNSGGAKDFAGRMHIGVLG